MPFRGMEKTKLLQNVGRGTRLIDVDRARLYSGEIKAKDWAKYVKPHCWLVLPVLSSEYNDQKRRYTDWIYALRSDYGFTSNDLVVIDQTVGLPEDKPLDDKVGKRERKMFVGKNLVNEIIHSIEDGEAMSEFMDNVFAFNTLSVDRQISTLREIYAE